MTTIRKGTKRVDAILAQAENVRCYSLDNGFTGEPLVENPIVRNAQNKYVNGTVAEYLHDAMDRYDGKMTVDDQGRYKIRIHSNLWYTFTSKGG